MNPFKSIRISHAAAAAALIPFTAGMAHAADAPQGDPAGFGQFIPLIVIMVIFYFLLIRPQQKRIKEHKNLVTALKSGDRIVTGGGIIGTVTDADENTLKVEIADGVKVTVKRDTILGLAE